jgi:hypothetical protein
MSSDYEYSDEEADYYDEDDEEMMDTQEDGLFLYHFRSLLVPRQPHSRALQVQLHQTTI